MSAGFDIRLLPGWRDVPYARFFAYALFLEGRHVYCGFTTDLGRRLWQHWHGYGARMTRRFRPVSILAIEPCHSYDEAHRMEGVLFCRFAPKYNYSHTRGWRFTDPDSMREWSPRCKRFARLWGSPVRF